MMRSVFIIACLSLLTPQWGMGPGPGTPHAAGGANCGSYSFCEAIVVDHTKMGSIDESGFPVLVTGSTNTKTVGNGGKATNASGFDVTFFPTNSCSGTKLNWETEVYSASATTSEYWLLPTVTVSHTVDTTVGYRCIGNAAVTTDQSNKTAVWDSNYAYVGHLPNGTTLTANDSTTNVNNGTLVNTPTATTGQIDGAAALASASSQGINLGSSSTLKIAGTITLEAWIKPTTVIGLERIVSNLTTSSFTGAEILIHDGSSSPSFVPYFQVGNAGTLHTALGNASIVAGTVYKIVGTYDGTNGMIYVNGALANSSVFGASAIGASTVNTFIGSWTNGGNNLNGWADEVRVSKIARSADWILAEYNNENSPGTFYSLVTQ